MGTPITTPTSTGSDHPQPPATTTRPRLYRAGSGRLLGGVAAGIAHHLGVPPIMVRLAFVALLLVNGAGALLYAVFWAVLPIDQPQRPAGRRDTGQLIAFLALALGAQLILFLSNAGSASTLAGWLVALVAVGAGIIWHQADPQRRRQWSAQLPRLPWLAAYIQGHSAWALAVRLGAGGLLMVAGIVGIVAVASPIRGGTEAVANGLLFTLLAVAGLAVVLGPLIWRVMVQLRTEREGRIREQERAELAALVHDQVLHTLALIQRNASDQREVLRLARLQERTLRNWLYKPTASPTDRLTAALEEAAAEVEDTLAVSVDTVVVGDCPVDPHVAALVAAAREALVNAGKHAKVTTVSLYAEVEPGQVSVFVRDRGVGFDPAAVNDDRHGIRGSIRGRMVRHGGTAEVRSTPGEGTEVRLFLPRAQEPAADGQRGGQP